MLYFLPCLLLILYASSATQFFSSSLLYNPIHLPLFTTQCFTSTIPLLIYYFYLLSHLTFSFFNTNPLSPTQIFIPRRLLNPSFYNLSSTSPCFFNLLPYLIYLPFASYKIFNHLT